MSRNSTHKQKREIVLVQQIKKPIGQNLHLTWTLHMLIREETEKKTTLRNTEKIVDIFSCIQIRTF